MFLYCFLIVCTDTASAFVLLLQGTPTAFQDMTSQLVFTVVVVVTDTGGLTSAQGNMTITVVKGNNRPIISAATFTTPENVPIGTAMGTVVARDRDVGQVISFRIVSGDSLGVFAIDSSTGAITVAKSALNFEGIPRYDLLVEVNDNNGTAQLTASATVVILLTNINEVCACELRCN